jgi:hypothetical protein
MANPEHLSILKQGVEAWNEWRRANYIKPDLSRADLRDANLREDQHIDPDTIVEPEEVGTSQPGGLLVHGTNGTQKQP